MTMTSTNRCRRIWQVLAPAGLAFAAATAHAGADHVNATAGGPLRPGVYGRIALGKAPPPPVIYDKPVVASRAILPATVKPVYLYVPPGQVRKWARHCAKYHACDLPVYFVRMDNSPGKLGRWKARPDVNAAPAHDGRATRLPRLGHPG